MSNLYEWFHDDITWCGNECSHTECERNQANMLDKSGLHSYALFKDTETCPLNNNREIKIINEGNAWIADSPDSYSKTFAGKSTSKGIEISAIDQYGFWANNPNVEFLHNINLNDTGEIGEWTVGEKNEN